MITCIVPVYNRSELLRRAISSVLAQSVATQLIVVDDASTEDIAAVLDSFPRVPGTTLEYHRIAKRGANGARAWGQQHARGDYVQFLDSDDELLPAKWALQLRHLESTPNLDVSVSATMMEGLPQPRLVDRGYPWHRISAAAFLMGRTSPKTGAPLWRRGPLQRVVEWPSNLASGQDWEAHFRALLCGLRLAYCPGAAYIIHRPQVPRIADTPVPVRAVNSILAMYYAVGGARQCGARIPWWLRMAVLARGAHRLFVCHRHGGRAATAPAIAAYRELVASCFGTKCGS